MSDISGLSNYVTATKSVTESYKSQKLEVNAKSRSAKADSFFFCKVWAVQLFFCSGLYQKLWHCKCRFRKNAYPHFVKYTPNHYPWHPFVDTDEGYIYEAAKAAIFLAEQLKGRKPSNFGIESFTAATRQLPCLVISGEKVSFGEPITVPNPVPQPYTSPTPSNEVLIKKVKKLKRKN